MIRPYAASLAILVALASAAFVAVYALEWPFNAVAGLVLMLAAVILPGRVFDYLATPEERRRDLEDRVRNPPS